MMLGMWKVLLILISLLCEMIFFLCVFRLFSVSSIVVVLLLIMVIVLVLVSLWISLVIRLLWLLCLLLVRLNFRFSGQCVVRVIVSMVLFGNRVWLRLVCNIVLVRLNICCMWLVCCVVRCLLVCLVSIVLFSLILVRVLCWVGLCSLLSRLWRVVSNVL